MQWMILHAEAVMDLVERPFSEIQFRQHIGDFNVLQGKWMLNPVEPLVSCLPIWGGSSTCSGQSPCVSVANPVEQGV